MILVKISNFSLSNIGFVILLEDMQKQYTLSIFIGIPEAQAITVQFNKLHSPRPLTHDLLENILKCLDSKVSEVIIDDLIENTFYAKITIENKHDKFQVDARPSDAIALALRFNIPIYVKETVMHHAGIPTQEEHHWKKQSAEKTRIEKLQEQLQHAVEEERYEDAAKFRDEINHIRN